MYVSLKDVAARAGVSFQTAGKVLNNNPGVVSAATRQRILTAADELGYLPNALARSLVTRSTYTIGVIADDLGDWVLAQFVVGAEREAFGQGHAVLISTAHRRDGGFESSVRHLLERRVDGIVAAAPSLEDAAGYGERLRGPVPAVSIHHVPGGGVPVVGSDHAETGRLAAEHLIGLGHRRIGTITGLPGRRVARSRLRGFRCAIDAAGVSLPEHRVVSARWTEQDGFAAATALLERAPDLTAIFAHTDLMATGALAALARSGRRVPDDCALMGCDDIPAAGYLIPALSTISIPVHDTGRRAMELLLQRVSGEWNGDPDGRALLPVRLVPRESTLGRSQPVTPGRDPPARGGSGPVIPAPAQRSPTRTSMLPHRKDDA